MSIKLQSTVKANSLPQRQELLWRKQRHSLRWCTPPRENGAGQALADGSGSVVLRGAQAPGLMNIHIKGGAGNPSQC